MNICGERSFGKVLVFRKPGLSPTLDSKRCYVVLSCRRIVPYRKYHRVVANRLLPNLGDGFASSSGQVRQGGIDTQKRCVTMKRHVTYIGKSLDRARFVMKAKFLCAPCQHLFQDML